MPPEYRYFKPEEVEGLNQDFVAKLDLGRAKTIELDVNKRGVPFVITSGLRTPEHNQSIIGAVPDSAHLTGHAVDLQVGNSHDVWLILNGCRMAGLNRFGIYVDANFIPIHIHVDDDPDKVPEVIWIKQEGTVQPEKIQIAQEKQGGLNDPVDSETHPS